LCLEPIWTNDDYRPLRKTSIGKRDEDRESKRNEGTIPTGGKACVGHINKFGRKEISGLEFTGPYHPYIWDQ